jgi:DNA replication protein DnaD
MSWIKLHKELLDSDIWNIEEPFTYRSAFIHVLLSANWKDGVFSHQGHILKVKRGQWLTSIYKLASTFKWDRKKVYKWLKYMEAAGMITTESYNFGTTLTVVNYDKFQSDGATVEHTEEHTAEHKTGHMDSHTVEHTEEHMTDPRSKTTDYRQQTTDSQSPAAAGPPPAVKREPPIGSKEWLALHYDD